MNYCFSGPEVAPDEPGWPAGPAWLAGLAWPPGWLPGWPGWHPARPGTGASSQGAAPPLLSPQVGYVVCTHLSGRASRAERARPSRRDVSHEIFLHMFLTDVV